MQSELAPDQRKMKSSLPAPLCFLRPFAATTESGLPHNFANQSFCLPFCPGESAQISPNKRAQFVQIRAISVSAPIQSKFKNQLLIKLSKGISSYLKDLFPKPHPNLKYEYRHTPRSHRNSGVRNRASRHRISTLKQRQTPSQR